MITQPARTAASIPASAGGPDTVAGAGDDPHLGLSPLLLATRLTGTRTAVLRVPLHWRERGWRPRPLELGAKALAFLGPHLRLVKRLWVLRDHDLLIVREFLTQFLMLVWPAIWPLRRRVCFLINHNLQEAHRRWFERQALRLLYLTGCRFACLETSEGLAEIGLRPERGRVLVIPHPLAPLAPEHRLKPAGRIAVVGVIGEVRAEKGSERMLEILCDLVAEGRLKARLLLGCPDPAARATWQGRGFEVVDTTGHQEYLAALDRSDVVVLNYRRERYFYRASGVAADAIAMRTMVVCPNFPIMRRQLTVPAPVGALFDDVEEIGQAIRKALALGPGLRNALEAHARSRNAVALAAILDDFVETGRGG